MGLYKRGAIWWVCLTHEGRKIRKSLDVKDKKTAERIYHKLMCNLVEGVWFSGASAEAKRATITTLLQRYVEERTPLKSLQSQRRDMACMQRFVDRFGAVNIQGLQPRDVVVYKTDRRREGAAPATINKELGLLRHAYNVAIKEWQWTDRNPVACVSLERVRPHRERWLTRDEEARLLEAAAPWLRPVIVFAVNTGMRRGELMALSWPHVDFERSTATVATSKTDRPRTVPLNASSLAVLLEREPSRVRSTLVFVADKDAVSKAFVAAVRHAGIPHIRFHDLRHTFATRLVQAGVDLYVVQRLLGHASPTMTQRYAHHSPDSLRPGVNRLSHAQPGPAADTGHTLVTLDGNMR